MTDTPTTATKQTRSWIFYAALLIIFWGVWGAFSALPATKYEYPDEMIYSIWALTMIIPAAFILRGQRWDRRPAATIYGLLIGLTGAGGQLILFQALTMGPAYLIFPIISISPAITVIMAMVLLRERLKPLAVVGLVMALAAIVLFTITGGEAEESKGPWLLLAILICVAWGVQAYFMRKTATIGVNEATTFGWMTISGLAADPGCADHGRRHPHRLPLAGTRIDGRHPGAQRGRRTVPRDGPRPREGLHRGTHDECPRACTDRRHLADRLPDPAHSLRRDRHRARARRLHVDGLQRREARRRSHRSGRGGHTEND